MKTYNTILITDEKELADYKKAFDNNNSPKYIEKLEWMHFHNPVNTPLVSITYGKGGEVASIYAVMPIFFKIENSLVKACQSLDTLTDINHRGKGLFVESANNVYKSASESDYKLVYGFPNGSSVHGFIKKLNWKLLDPVPFLFKPLKSGYFLKKILGNSIGSLLNFNISSTKKIGLSKSEEIIEIKRFSKDSDVLWESFSSLFKVSINRNSDYLNWRFVEKPDENYKRYGFYRNGKLLGFIVFINKDKHSGNIGYIMELIVLPNEAEVGKKLLQWALNDFIKNKVDVILSWCFQHSPNFQIFKSKRFFDLPEKLKPIELHFGYANFNADEGIVCKRENWYLSYADSDTV
jgi:hypothetical protein